MSDRDYKDFSNPGADLNHDGKVDFAEYDNDFEDFNRATNNSKKYSPTKPANTGGFFNWLKWQGCGTWIIGLLIAFTMPMPISVILIVIIAILFVIMLITA